MCFAIVHSSKRPKFPKPFECKWVQIYPPHGYKRVEVHNGSIKVMDIALREEVSPEILAQSFDLKGCACTFNFKELVIQDVVNTLRKTLITNYERPENLYYEPPNLQTGRNE